MEIKEEGFGRQLRREPSNDGKKLPVEPVECAQGKGGTTQSTGRRQMPGNVRKSS